MSNEVSISTEWVIGVCSTCQHRTEIHTAYGVCEKCLFHATSTPEIPVSECGTCGVEFVKSENDNHATRMGKCSECFTDDAVAYWESKAERCCEKC